MGTSEPVAGAIARNNATFMQRFGDGDAAGVAGLYTKDSVLLPPGSDPLAGRDAVEGFWKAAMGMGVAGIALETDDVEDAGEVAVETCRYVLSVGDGQEIDNGKYLVVWRQEGGEWSLHRDMWNTSRAPA